MGSHKATISASVICHNIRCYSPRLFHPTIPTFILLMKRSSFFYGGSKFAKFRCCQVYRCSLSGLLVYLRHEFPFFSMVYLRCMTVLNTKSLI